jgi:riboflavin kinase/FMN adenylyltransferase
MLTGEVQKGKGLGKKLNFPTANLFVKEQYKLIPKNGVYVVKSEFGGKVVYGMMNIGYNPTVNKEQHAPMDDLKSIEIHFLDFEENLYGKKLQVKIIDRIRDEQKFDSLDALQLQLQKDKETSLAIITR